ncbi:MAG TPA: hypothetical protein VFY93_19775 [Planctomycetota bacterium]|nr:hypothetical protein [Planctomycetota bacterium]
MAATFALLLCAGVFDPFDEPLDPARWYVGVPGAPEKGWMKIPRDGWIVARGLPEDKERIEIVFRHSGGSLEVAFFDEKEPLSSPRGTPLLIPPGAGARTLVLTAAGAEVDGKAAASPGFKGTFRLRAAKGDVEIDEVRVTPRGKEPPPPDGRIVFAATCPPVCTEGKTVYACATLTLWDVDVLVLLARGEPAFAELRAPPKGSPVLGALVRAGDGKALAKKAGGHPLARGDWRDEAKNLPKSALDAYLETEYAVFALVMDTQRALNAAAASRKDLEPLVHLALIRHANNVHAAVGLAETEGARDALAALRKALKGEDPSGASDDRLRAAAAEAARAILGEPPAEWPGFSFDATRRYVSMTRAKEIAEDLAR